MSRNPFFAKAAENAARISELEAENARLRKDLSDADDALEACQAQARGLLRTQEGERREGWVHKSPGLGWLFSDEPWVDEVLLRPATLILRPPEEPSP